MPESETLKKALYAIKKLKQQLAAPQAPSFQPIAIVGIACRFPEANNKQEYWRLLCEGRNIISDMPEERWQLLNESDEFTIKNQHAIKGGYLRNIDAFDAYFFGLTPREVMRMDPQQRLLLEVAYEAIEDAGIPLEELAGSNTGVFASLYASQFAYMQQLSSDQDALYIPTGNAVSMAANRLSYFFDLHGPSVVFDSACSSSLVALHQACFNLQNKSCQLALVAAANINLQPSMNVMLSKAKMLSPNGQCKTFDASADGYVQGEGVGVIVLKLLANALENNDRIYAVIGGSAINQDGKTNGLTAPNGLQQAALLRSAYQVANCSPSDVSYIECHGTGTFLGDPIELQALGEVISQDRSAEKPCFIGSVKTNIGHLEPAAGMAGVIKVALSLYYAKIPAHLNFSVPNPHIEFEKNHLRVATHLTDWPDYNSTRLAGISSFGFGGTNAHTVLRDLTIDEKKSAKALITDDIQPLFILSARDITALRQLIEKWCIYLEENRTLDLTTIFYNLQKRRSHHFYRLAIIVETKEQLARDLLDLKNTLPSNWQLSNSIFINLNKEKLPNNGNTELYKLAFSYINREKISWPFNSSINMLDIPAYPWQYVNYWPSLIKKRDTNLLLYPFLRKKIASPLNVVQFEFHFSTDVMPEIKDTFNFLHIGYYIEMLSTAVQSTNQNLCFTAEDFSFLMPLFVPDNSIVTVQLILETHQENVFTFAFYSQAHDNQWIKHATGKLLFQVKPAESIMAGCQLKASSHDSDGQTEENFYARVTAMRMPGKGSIRWTRQFFFHQQDILCKFEAPSSATQGHAFEMKMHPGIFDACVQSLFLLLPDDLIKPFVAAHIKKLTFYGFKNTVPNVVANLKNIADSRSSYTGDFCLMQEDGAVIAICEDLQMMQLDNNMRLGNTTQLKCDLSNLKPEERHVVVVDFLLQEVASLFSMPIEDISVHHSLSEMGMDSLMAMALSFNINRYFDKNYPAPAILQGPTILEIADALQENIPKTRMTENRWIAYRQKKNQPALRLFCFPYGGGGASIFKNWQKQLPDTIEICPIQLPGREERLEETLFHQFDTLIETLVTTLQDELTPPFAFFGHSFGSLIGFELARALRRKNMPQPERIFASAFPDPRIPTKSLDNMISQLLSIDVNLFNLMDPTAIALVSDEKLTRLAAIFRDNGLVEYGTLAMSKDIIKILLPIFVGDMSLVKSYRYHDESPLNIPITVFCGKYDTWVSYEDHLGWKTQTQKTCDFHLFDSGHLFIKENDIQSILLKQIANQLLMQTSHERA